MRTLAQFREDNESMRQPTNERMGTTSIELPQVSGALAAVTSMVSVVETFTIRVTSKKLRLSLKDQPRVAADALAEIEKQVDRSWADRAKGWRVWYNINAYEFAPFIAFISFVEARNAAMHGDGRLTAKQLANDGGQAVITQLQQVGIRTIAGKLELDPKCVKTCADACCGFTLWIDERISNASPVVAKSPP
jgi:hypothetical protein